jgi:hypothetical protein
MNSSSNINQQQQAAADGTPAPPDKNEQGGVPSNTAPNLTKTKYDLIADEVLKDLAALRAALPKVDAAQGIAALTAGKRVRTTREFLASAVDAIAASAELAAVTQLDAARGQETLQLLDAYGRLVKEFEAFTRDARFVIAATKAQFGAEAREAYTAAKGLSRTVKGAPLVTHVQAMKRGARFGHGRPKQQKGGGTQPMQKQM